MASKAELFRVKPHAREQMGLTHDARFDPETGKYDASVTFFNLPTAKAAQQMSSHMIEAIHNMLAAAGLAPTSVELSTAGDDEEDD